MAIRLNTTDAPVGRRDIVRSMLHGVQHRCPNCGGGGLFERYLKVRDHCAGCGEALHHHRADDAPPYFTIFIVGHIAVGGVLAMEKAMQPSVWLHAAIWVPFVLFASLALLPCIKGSLVALQWALRMHGFGDDGIATPTPQAPIPGSPARGPASR